MTRIEISYKHSNTNIILKNNLNKQTEIKLILQEIKLVRIFNVNFCIISFINKQIISYDTLLIHKIH